MKDKDWAYLAGIIDADGSIGIYLVPKGNGKRQYNHQLSFCGDKLLMDWVNSNIPSSRIFLAHRTWMWITNRKAVIIQVLSNTIKYMTTKQEEARLMLEYLVLDKPDRELYSSYLKLAKRLRHSSNEGAYRRY